MIFFLLSFFPTLFLYSLSLSFSIYCFGNLWIVKKLYPLHPVTGTLSIVLFLLLTKPIVYVYMIGSFFFLFLFRIFLFCALHRHAWMLDYAYSHGTHVFIRNSSTYRLHESRYRKKTWMMIVTQKRITRWKLINWHVHNEKTLYVTITT
jgi:hypothetical protein